MNIKIEIKSQKGITLIALVITIIVLLILAGITIASITGQDSAPEKAVQAKIENDKGAIRDAVGMLVTEKVSDYYEGKYVNSSTDAKYGGTILTYLENELADGKNVTTNGYIVVVANGTITATKTGESTAFVKGTVTPEGVISWEDSNAGGGSVQAIEVPEVGSTFVALSDEKNVKVKDANNKVVIVPVGFRISPNSGTTIEQGIVIEDVNQNEFVWVPVGTEVTYSSTYNSSTLKAKLGEITTSGTITLGRYDFGTSSNRKQEIKSSASGTTANDVISTYYTESASAFTIGSKTYQPSVAKSITNFISQTNEAGGYYIGRYEMGRGKVCQSNKTVYSNVTRDQALMAAQGMYTEAQTKGKFTCDLLNSYAWDTAIVFIEKCGTNSNYAFQTRLKSRQTPYLTGESGDEQCKIQDMASNVEEWTTEYSSYFSGDYPCVGRGGFCSDNDSYTSRRFEFSTTDSYDCFGFRPLIYVSSAES